MSTVTTTTAGRTTAAETGLAATTVQRRPSRASYTDDSEAHLFRSRLGSLSQQDYTQPIDEEEEQLKHHFDDSKATSDAENSRPPSPPVLATYPPSQAKPAELAAVDQGAAAWRFLACGFVIWSMVWGVAYSYGSFQDYHEHNPDSPLYGTSVTGISAVGTLVIGCQHFIPLILRGFVTTFPHLRRRLVLVSVVLSSACILVASFARSIAMLIVFQGVLFGVTSGVLLLPVVLYLGQWFDTRRGLATGVIFMGSGFGGVVFPLILNALLTSIGFAWTMRVWALAQLVLTGTALWFVNPRLPLETPDVLPITKLELAKALLPGDLSWLTHPLSLIYVSATRPQKVGDTRLIFFGCWTVGSGGIAGVWMVHCIAVHCDVRHRAWIQLDRLHRHPGRIQRIGHHRLYHHGAFDRQAFLHARHGGFIGPVCTRRLTSAGLCGDPTDLARLCHCIWSCSKSHPSPGAIQDRSTLTY
jgi:hypothetical protein